MSLSVPLSTSSIFDSDNSTTLYICSSLWFFSTGNLDNLLMVTKILLPFRNFVTSSLRVGLHLFKTLQICTDDIDTSFLLVYFFLSCSSVGTKAESFNNVQDPFSFSYSVTPSFKKVISSLSLLTTFYNVLLFYLFHSVLLVYCQSLTLYLRYKSGFFSATVALQIVRVQFDFFQFCQPFLITMSFINLFLSVLFVYSQSF